MEHMHTQITFLLMIGIYFISSILQKTIKIPLPHSIITIAFGLHYFYPELLTTSEHFDSLILFLIPLILMYDSIHLKFRYIKTFKWSILYLATFSVIVSLSLGVSLYYFNLFPFSIGAYVALFAIVMATDAISVGNIFSQFKNIPHNIKVLVEGESLGNDATAMIAFYFIGLPWIINGSFDFSTLPIIVLKLFFISTVIGFTIAFIGFFLLRYMNLLKQELLITLGVAYGTFTLAEILHVSGILSLIVGVITFTTLIENSLKEEEKDKNIYRFLRKQVTTKTRQENILNTIDIFSFLAVIIVFVSLATLIDIDKLILYWKEIFIMFIATTVIRAIVMLKFVLLSKKLDYVGFNGWIILTLAGIKGALSIIMLHAIPKSFEYYDLFEAVTIGVILLSIFVYGFSLLGYMLWREKNE